MDKFQDLLQHAKHKIRKLMKKDGEEEEASLSSEDKALDPKTPEGQKSLVKGDHGTIFGLSRPVVIGGVVIIFLIFSLSFMFAADNASNPDTDKKQDNKQADILDKNAKNNAVGNKLTDDYGDLARADAEKNKQAQKNNVVAQNGQNGGTVHAQQTTVPAMNSVSSSPTVSAVPRATVVSPSYTPPILPNYSGSYGNNYSLPSQDNEDGGSSSSSSSASVPTPAIPATATASPASSGTSILDDMKKRLSSAIAFATGDSGASSTGSVSDSGSSASSGGGEDTGSSSGGATYTAPDNNTVMAGTVIPAMLVTGINTDTPGQVYAQTMADVYSLDGDTVLIPAGSKILGSYGAAGGNDSGTSGRVNVTFNTLVTPDGGSWSIGDSMVAMDGAGYTGIAGHVHRHTGNNFIKGLWNSAMTALASAAADRVTFDSSALTAVAQTQAPTTTVDPGYTFSVYVTQNIAF